MSKKPFVIFGVLLVALAVLVPLWAFGADGDPEARTGSLDPSLEHGKELFDVNCGTCHTLYAAGTDGNFGPDLDEVIAPAGPPTGKTAAATIKGAKGRVLNAIEKGVDSTTTPGRMPAGILSGAQADAVAEFVAQTAGQG
ncbi:MAG TPA: cytochrome c [Solirubrobacterales bacterium]|nr:cytochrome c [Solirubrobacterales bacterium]